MEYNTLTLDFEIIFVKLVMVSPVTNLPTLEHYEPKPTNNAMASKESSK